jgi:hypothetical protein
MIMESPGYSKFQFDIFFYNKKASAVFLIKFFSLINKIMFIGFLKEKGDFQLRDIKI